MARRKLVDEVAARAKNSRPGFSSWYDRLPAEARKELDEVRVAFDNTVHQKTAYAQAIIDAATERGWKIGGVQVVVAWLNEKR